MLQISLAEASGKFLKIHLTIDFDSLLENSFSLSVRVDLMCLYTPLSTVNIRLPILHSLFPGGTSDVTPQINCETWMRILQHSDKMG